LNAGAFASRLSIQVVTSAVRSTSHELEMPSSESSAWAAQGVIFWRSRSSGQQRTQ
jgi:hypothetical protein